MKIKQLEKLNTKEDVRDFAIKWQAWTSNRSMSYLELANWQSVLLAKARKFRLVKEFKENGII